MASKSGSCCCCCCCCCCHHLDVLFGLFFLFSSAPPPPTPFFKVVGTLERKYKEFLTAFILALEFPQDMGFI